MEKPYNVIEDIRNERAYGPQICDNAPRSHREWDEYDEPLSAEELEMERYPLDPAFTSWADVNAMFI